jgi:hypothetical protein
MAMLYRYASLAAKAAFRKYFFVGGCARQRKNTLHTAPLGANRRPKRIFRRF